jgi:hypothetical protein
MDIYQKHLKATWQPGVIWDKEITQNYMYLAATNFWAPLDDITEELEEKEEQINKKQQTNKWTRRLEWWQQRWKENQIIINTGETSHFLSDNIDLPNMGQVWEEVFLPNGSTLHISHKTLLPFEKLMTAARKATVLPRLKKSLVSVSIWADEGYMTIFHPG